jgi:hypothetical protein
LQLEPRDGSTSFLPRLAATQFRDATACVSIRAASALLQTHRAPSRAQARAARRRRRRRAGLDDLRGNFDRVASFTHLGRQQVFDLTEPQTHSFVANGLTVHNCSEYMFLDDTACNLASLNVLTFFDAESRRFDVDGYKHAIRCGRSCWRSRC